MLLEGILHCCERDAKTTVVSDILAESETAVCMDTGKNLNLVELSGEFASFLVELGLVLSSPPVDHVSILVEHRALIVETVGHLMADDNTDTAIVDRNISLRIKERLLENSGRETNLVCGRIIISIDCLRSHPPLCLVGRFSKFGKIVGDIPLRRALKVLEIGLFGRDFKCAVVFPLVRILNLHSEGTEFLLRADLGRIAHPVQTVDVLAESNAEILYELDHHLLGRSGEIALDIHLADSFAKD